MTTLTKEQLISHARESVSYLEDLKGRVSKEGADCKVVIEMVARDLKLARIALASLEAKPIGAFHIAEQQVDGTSDYLKDGEWPIDNGTIEVYAAPPVPVVPEEKPMPNALSMLEREITQLIGDAQEATVTGYELIAEAWRLMDGQDPKTSDWHSKASKYLNSNIVEKVDDDRIEAVKAVLRRLAGNHPDFPDSSQQSPKKSVKTTLERGYLEAALKIKTGNTLGVIDAMLVHEMAKALLPLVADKIPNKADI
ncbi:hypothetical protein KPI62_15720 [Escherichia coli]|uniref:hypothetical protein n=1 Tax=Escherichia coli TaxID=562 RepID=UPI001C0DE3DB|nr:hypothetical protein [Escherichia coli]MBU3269362.1 hypothetical protein [Escherichia coli]MBU3274199.1 hypothetical protein [Escherichia coli]MBU3318217.1 hypothetical protein [Escherichia coli]MBU3318340.1 hypothetical protein [Escherichia coli]MCH7056207.1 hypothetical protein [Escherichia coli]